MFMHIICMSIKQISVSVTDLSAGINVFLEKPEHINDVGEV